MDGPLPEASRGNAEHVTAAMGAKRASYKRRASDPLEAEPQWGGGG